MSNEAKVALDRECPHCEGTGKITVPPDISIIGKIGWTICRACAPGPEELCLLNGVEVFVGRGSGRIPLTLGERKARVWDWYALSREENSAVAIGIAVDGNTAECFWSIGEDECGHDIAATAHEAVEAAVAEIRKHVPEWGKEVENG